jgi:hypothetical protein
MTGPAKNMAESMRWAQREEKEFQRAKTEKKKGNKNREGFLGC